MSGAKQGVRIGSVDVDEFLRVVARDAHSDAAGGAVGSQYEDQLRRGDPKVGIVGVYACDQFVSAASYGVHDLPRMPGSVSGRIDVVVTRPHVRGMGLGSLCMAALVLHFVQQHGEQLAHMSVVAQHPSVARFVERLGFVAAQVGTAPLYQLSLDPQNRTAIKKQAAQISTTIRAGFQRKCGRCMRGLNMTAWCQEAKGQAA